MTTPAINDLLAASTNNNAIQQISLIFTAVYGIPLILGLYLSFLQWQLLKHRAREGVPDALSQAERGDALTAQAFMMDNLQPVAEADLETPPTSLLPAEDNTHIGNSLEGGRDEGHNPFVGQDSAFGSGVLTSNHEGVAVTSVISDEEAVNDRLQSNLYDKNPHVSTPDDSTIIKHEHLDDQLQDSDHGDKTVPLKKWY